MIKQSEMESYIKKFTELKFKQIQDGFYDRAELGLVGRALLAYEQSKWTLFNPLDKNSWPDFEGKILLSTTDGSIPEIVFFSKKDNGFKFFCSCDSSKEINFDFDNNNPEIRWRSIPISIPMNS